jgi:predicted lipoprotein with Yx(FWY)xxD motif
MDHWNSKTRSVYVLVGLMIAVLLLASCGPEAIGLAPQEEPSATHTPVPTKTATVVPVPGATKAPSVNIKISSNAVVGSFLTDESGFTFYTSKKDTSGVSNCTGACLNTWPGVMTSDTPLADDPSVKNKIGVINRPDGGQQVTYKGMPLYYYSKDNIPGDTNGQGLNNEWYVVAP